MLPSCSIILGNVKGHNDNDTTTDSIGVIREYTHMLNPVSASEQRITAMSLLIDYCFLHFNDLTEVK